MKRQSKNHGFTLVELMVALMIASIVLAAVATLAGATTAADQVTDQMGREQSQLRMISMRLTDLIRRANRVTFANEEGFTLWHDLDADGIVDTDEETMVVIGADDDGKTITIGTSETYTKYKEITFFYGPLDGDNNPVADPDKRFITVSFDVKENGQWQYHSISARLWVSDEHDL